MTTSLQIKITISECVTPELFRAVSAVSNPRQRAALLKRLAEDALRSTVPTGQIAPAATSVTAGNRVIPRAVRSGAQPSSSSNKPGGLFSETNVFNEDERQFGNGCTADISSAPGATQTLQPIAEVRHYLVTGTPSPREIVASLSSITLDCKASVTNSTEGPRTPGQPRQYGEIPSPDTITQSSRRRGVLTWTFVTAALAMQRSGYRLGRAIIGRWKKGGEDNR